MVQLLSQNLNLNLTETCFWAHFKFAMLGAEKMLSVPLVYPGCQKRLWVRGAQRNTLKMHQMSNKYRKFKYCKWYTETGLHKSE